MVACDCNMLTIMKILKIIKVIRIVRINRVGKMTMSEPRRSLAAAAARWGSSAR
jgi:hypothetical protein